MSWTLAYAHDATGAPLEGCIDVLTHAIRNGQPVRVLMEESVPENLTVIDAQWLWIRNGIVYAQNTASISVDIKNDLMTIKQEAYHYFVTVSTKADRDMSRWRVGEHARPKSGSQNHDKVAMKWFVG